MKLIQHLLNAVLLLVSLTASSQEFTVPKGLPVTKEEFVKSEKDMIAASKWLEATPVGMQAEKLQQVNAWVMGWVINSPTVNIELGSGLITLFTKNEQLNFVFLAAYSRYCLENNYSKDALKASTAGVHSMIACFDLGGKVKNTDKMKKAIEAEKEGRLEEWVDELLKKK